MECSELVEVDDGSVLGGPEESGAVADDERELVFQCLKCWLCCKSQLSFHSSSARQGI